jgi:phospholipid/cholesterol/gamma-HCH transport system permease protein
MVAALGKTLIHMGKSLDDFVAMVVLTIAAILRLSVRLSETIRQVYFVANQSVVIIVFCVSFAAAVTVLESSFHMRIVVQNDSMVPGFASLLILRELAVVVMALLLTSRVGAGMAAEIGTMQVTEQIDALRILGIDPIRFLVVPRFIAGIFSGAILSIIASIACLFAAMMVSRWYLGFTAGSFLTAMRTFVGFQDLMFAMVKGATFGAIIPLVACHCGFRCKAGAEGVGLATTQSVVLASIAIIITDFILSYIFSYFY